MDNLITLTTHAKTVIKIKAIAIDAFSEDKGFSIVHLRGGQSIHVIESIGTIEVRIKTAFK